MKQPLTGHYRGPEQLTGTHLQAHGGMPCSRYRTMPIGGCYWLTSVGMLQRIRVSSATTPRINHQNQRHRQAINNQLGPF